VARLSLLELAADGRKHALDLVAQGDQDGNGHHRDEGQDQSIFNEGLTLLALETTQRRFGASNNFVNHCIFHLLSIKNVQNFKSVPAARLWLVRSKDHFACHVKTASKKDSAL
jgi:hypothetical protein